MNRACGILSRREAAIKRLLLGIDERSEHPVAFDQLLQGGLLRGVAGNGRSALPDCLHRNRNRSIHGGIAGAGPARAVFRRGWHEVVGQPFERPRG